MQTTLDAEGIETSSRQPLPSQPLPGRPRRGSRGRRVVLVGELRLPLAGPYAPRARLLRFPDGRLLWRVRLWEYDHPVSHVVGTETLRAFARCNGLARLGQEIETLVARASRPELR